VRRTPWSRDAEVDAIAITGGDTIALDTREHAQPCNSSYTGLTAESPRKQHSLRVFPAPPDGFASGALDGGPRRPLGVSGTRPGDDDREQEREKGTGER
jgi:hypothetical protein